MAEFPISLRLEGCDGFANAVQKAHDLRGKMEPELVDAVVSRFIEAAIANPPTITAQLGDNINSHLSPHADAVYTFVAAHKSVNTDRPKSSQRRHGRDRPKSSQYKRSSAHTVWLGLMGLLRTSNLLPLKRLAINAMVSKRHLLPIPSLPRYSTSSCDAFETASWTQLRTTLS